MHIDLGLYGRSRDNHFNTRLAVSSFGRLRVVKPPKIIQIGEMPFISQKTSSIKFHYYVMSLLLRTMFKVPLVRDVTVVENDDVVTVVENDDVALVRDVTLVENDDDAHV